MLPTLPPFVTWSDVADTRAKDPESVLADTRWYWDRSGRQAWEAGHVPGATFVDLNDDLSDAPTPTTGRHPFPSPEHFAAAMSRAGIDGNHPVFAYDDAGGVIAARLVWMLRCLNLPASVISGGISAYDGPLRGGEEPIIRARRFAPRPWPMDRLISTQEIAEAVLTGDRPTVRLIDARPANRFHGEEPEVDARLGAVPKADPRAGHIPTARNIPCRENLDADGYIHPPEQLRATFSAAGIDEDNVTHVVSYCGSGVTACHNLLALEQAGLGPATLYPGSWSAWSHATELPVE